MGSCHLCERLSSVVRGAKCAAHESSTSPSVDRRRHDFGPPGALGPVPFVLAGGDLRRAPRSTVERYVAILVTDGARELLKKSLAWESPAVHVTFDGETLRGARVQSEPKKEA